MWRRNPARFAPKLRRQDRDVVLVARSGSSQHVWVVRRSLSEIINGRLRRRSDALLRQAVDQGDRVTARPVAPGGSTRPGRRTASAGGWAILRVGSPARRRRHNRGHGRKCRWRRLVTDGPSGGPKPGGSDGERQQGDADVPVVASAPERTWIWSDLHLSDPSVLLGWGRPFPSVEEMNWHLLRNWRRRVDAGGHPSSASATWPIRMPGATTASCSTWPNARASDSWSSAITTATFRHCVELVSTRPAGPRCAPPIRRWC